MSDVDAQKREFYTQGYNILRNAVDPDAVKEALKWINFRLGEEGMIPGGSYPVTLRNNAYDIKRCDDQPILDLATRSSLYDWAETMIGRYQPISSGQIALGFPTEGDPPVEIRGHLDGMGGGKYTRVKEGEFLHANSVIALVYLCDLPEPYMGNFTVWPGSHHYFEERFRQHGGPFPVNGMDHEGMPHGPVPITGKAGDIVVGHHQLYHARSPNFSPFIRYGVVLRLNHVEVKQNGLDVLTDIWREFDGLQAMAATAEPA